MFFPISQITHTPLTTRPFATVQPSPALARFCRLGSGVGLVLLAKGVSESHRVKSVVLAKRGTETLCTYWPASRSSCLSWLALSVLGEASHCFFVLRTVKGCPAVDDVAQCRLSWRLTAFAGVVHLWALSEHAGQKAV